MSAPHFSRKQLEDLGIMVPKSTPRSAPAVGRGMNRWEREYADRLELQRIAGMIRYWKFEALKLKLAKATWYTPDFLVITQTGAVELHEVKGYWRDDARVKFKTAAELFREFTFVIVKKRSKAWAVTPHTP